MIIALLLAAAPISVDEVLQRHIELNGKIIKVRGWLEHCANEDCALISKRGPLTRGWDGHVLAIGYDAAFDRAAVPFVGHRVALTAKFDDMCLRGKVICLDRAHELTPTGEHPLSFMGPR